MLYKNLLYLKNYDGDVQDLGLDFTIGKAIFWFKFSPQDGTHPKKALSLCSPTKNGVLGGFVVLRKQSFGHILNLVVIFFIKLNL